MIWVKDTAGSTVYLSPEWSTFTGQPVGVSAGWGWLFMVHPDDRLLIRDTIRRAVEAGSEFSLAYRLQHGERGFVWVLDGGIPALSGSGGEVTGFLGSITEVPEGLEAALGSLGSFRPPPPVRSTLPGSALDLVADHLLIARAIAGEVSDREVVNAVEIALLVTGRLLARETLGKSPRPSFQ